MVSFAKMNRHPFPLQDLQSFDDLDESREDSSPATEPKIEKISQDKEMIDLHDIRNRPSPRPRCRSRQVAQKIHQDFIIMVPALPQVGIGKKKTPRFRGIISGGNGRQVNHGVSFSKDNPREQQTINSPYLSGAKHDKEGSFQAKGVIKMNNYPFFEVEKIPAQQTAILYLNRPEKLNAMNWPFWRDLAPVVKDLENDPDVRVVIVAGKGKSFSVGIDVFDFFTAFSETIQGATPEKREEFYRLILQMQEGFTCMAQGENIYIGAAHRHCIGAGLDLMSACDIRLATKDVVISLRETKIAIVADMGSLNRLPQIIGQGNTRMMAYTGRDFNAEECLRMGLLNEIYDSQESLMEGALKLAAEIADNSPAAVKGTKKILNYMEDHSVEDGLKYVAAWNSAFFNTKEVQEVFMKTMARKQEKK